jgi:hypothetical protein
VLPVTAEAPRVVFEPKQIALLSPAAAAGKGFTVTTTLFDLVQLVTVMVSVTV